MSEPNNKSKKVSENSDPSTSPHQTAGIDHANSHSNINTFIDNDKQSPTMDPCYRLSFKVGVAEDKNTQYRPTMEDVHTYVANFAEKLDWGYFAIFDGHAGKQSAKWCGNNLHTILETEICNHDTADMRDNLCNAFIEADKSISATSHGSSGCTAAVAIIRWELNEDFEGDSSLENEALSKNTVDAPYEFIPSKFHKRMLYTANVGDSRVVLCRNGVAYRLSYDHKGTDKNESKRILDAGGVMMKSRVNGMLAVTRSLGDTYMKELVIGKPFTTATRIDSTDEFMIIACDGLWDVCTDQTAADLIRNIQDTNDAAKVLCEYAMEKMTTDNITVMVVRFDPTVFSYRDAPDAGKV